VGLLKDSISNTKYKILFFVEAFGGGVFSYMVDLSNYLSDSFEVYIAHGIRDQTPKDYITYFKDTVHLIHIREYTRSINPMQDMKAIIRMKLIESEIDPDVIHLHSSKSGVLGRIAFNGRYKPLFYTPHGYSFLMDSCKKSKKLLYKMIERTCGLRKCKTISCSEGEYKESIKLVRNSSYINNGINIQYISDMLDRTQTDLELREGLVIFTLGRICFQKNPEVFNAIAERHQDIKFLWIGDGELRDKLVSSNIEVTGWVSREQALQKCINADIFLLTSLWEGLPISLLESMFMKKLCVVSNVIGNHDVIKNGKNGFVCNTVDEFVDLINNIKSRQIEVEHIVDNSYKDILLEYNTSVMAEKYSNEYLNALEQSVIRKRCLRFSSKQKNIKSEILFEQKE
jgi:glycosyltransferase involved in cell wall biosynthesis